MKSFSNLGLSQATCGVLENLGFTEPTPIQVKAIPYLIGEQASDFIGLAQTGTGKTAAFGLPLMDLLDPSDRRTQALILAPTRELGQQIAGQIKNFAVGGRLNVVVVYGGEDVRKQLTALKKPTQIIVATPGRLLDLVKRKAIKLDAVRTVVLDEADEMLNMGFKEELDLILAYTPEEKSTWLFSATMPSAIKGLVNKYMTNPFEVRINASEVVNKDIEHQYVVTKTADKLEVLKRFLDINPDMRGVVFCRTKIETQEIADALSNQNYEVEALHGDLNQNQRDVVMKKFKTRGMQMLIATDVAARGIDVSDLTHVFHHKLPDQIEIYTHRSGRTGRAGNKGISMVLINPREKGRIRQIENRLKVSFKQVDVPTKGDLRASRMQHWASLILNTNTDKHADAIYAELEPLFADFSKEDLMKRLITSQLDHLFPKGGVEDDINMGDGQSESKRPSNANRFFVNIGEIDGLTKEDLIHFMSDVSGIKRKHFTELALQKNCAFFFVPKEFSGQLSSSFKDIDIDGRAIRVNRDDDGPKARNKGKQTKRHKPSARKKDHRKYSRRRH